MVKLPFTFGHISQILEKAIELAKSENDEVEVEFNGLKIIVNQNTSVEVIQDWVLEQFEKKKNEYWTPARLQEKANREQKDFLNLQLHYETLSKVSSIQELLHWFCELEKRSFIHARLNNNQIIKLKDKCQNEFDIYPGMNCSNGESKEQWNNHSTNYKLQWLIGQALDTTLMVRSPDQVIHGFAKDFGIK